VGSDEDVGAAEERIVSERIAIGDVHGCSAALAALVRAIDLTALDTLVFLGDYIDRGRTAGACWSR
jgi:serine/threonine protein phosphatase 1